MLELFLLLLPLAAFSGWLIGRRDANQQREYSDVSLDYLQSLSFLLNDQQDKALDIFVRMLETNSEVVEIHLALGNLFRKQGEVERSIRIHQNLIARPTLKPEHRSQALYELAQDYMKAGLLDRAEKLFLEILDKRKFTLLALRNLLDIYQQEKDWLKAIQIAERLNHMSEESYKNTQSHFYCELADISMRENDFKTARLMIQKATFTDKTNIRASILEGDLFSHDRKYKLALKSYNKVSNNDADFFGEVMDKIIQSYVCLGKEADIAKYFMNVYKNKPGILVSATFSDFLFLNGNDEIFKLLVHRLSEIKTTDELLGVFSLATKRPELVSQNLDKIFISVQNILQHKTRYKCSNCGFRAKSIHWYCPGCHQWGCIKPSLTTAEASMHH